MIEVEIDVEDDNLRTGEMIEWITDRSHARGRIDYQGTNFKRSRFRFSDISDAVFFKLAWG